MPRSPAPDPEGVNEVRLVGRVSAPPEARTLPSGDEVATWRVVVPRSGADGVDTIDCAGWTAAVRRSALRLQPGSRVEVHGRLRRRFWRGATGPASRYEVEVVRLRRA